MFIIFNKRKKLQNRDEFCFVLARKNTAQTLFLLHTSIQGLTQKTSQQRREFYRRYTHYNVRLNQFFSLLMEFFKSKKSAIFDQGKCFATVKRKSKNGISIIFEIPYHQLVLGDIIQIKKGDTIPTNVRILESDHLIVNQACYTGLQDYTDKYPSEKIMATSTNGNLSYISMLQLPQFCLVGTEVISGNALAVVLMAYDVDCFSAVIQSVVREYRN